MALSRSPKPMMRVRFFPFLPVVFYTNINKNTNFTNYTNLTTRLWLFYEM